MLGPFARPDRRCEPYAEQQTFLASIDDPDRRQALRDYMINQQFRRDIFIKGSLPLSLPESRALWSEQRFALTTCEVMCP